MKKVMATCLASLIVTGTAMAIDKDASDHPTGDMAVAHCAVDGYKSWDADGLPLTLPDNDPAGVSFVVSTLDDGDCFAGVTVIADLEHTWMGDIVLTMSYDMDGDGTSEIGPFNILCRTGDNDCGVDGGFGCSDDFLPGDPFTFSDRATDDLADVCTAGDAVGGCYYGADGVDMFSAFDGIPKGGNFMFNISDNGGGDTGRLLGFSVYSQNTPCTVPVEESTWGGVKATFAN